MVTEDQPEPVDLMSLPPIMRNRIPGIEKIEDEKEKFLYDVEHRPEVASLEDYERVPTEKFGEAMLRGMGWRPGTPVGLKSREIVPVREYIKRPHRLGLGARPKAPPEVKRKEGWIPKPGESRDGPIFYEPIRDANGKVRHWRTLDEKLTPMRYADSELLKEQPDTRPEKSGSSIDDLKERERSKVYADSELDPDYSSSSRNRDRDSDRDRDRDRKRDRDSDRDRDRRRDSKRSKRKRDRISLSSSDEDDDRKKAKRHRKRSK
eukprot:TRINITY_DN299_c0_g1_i3.p1 TRINITY_DN299_c0_g1~~TRINITY_DN299_c0_g1_i3.p1  ORF type:complete len:263 (+),score=51.04 TRINITY_DN299_c0_g1_i3:265-1053(+)